ncbi:MAG: TIGR02147 family protein [Chitinispirillaceae bacterium]|nr:TIGR02147 family protein [Chitinispirillaceae bacterium]
MERIEFYTDYRKFLKDFYSEQKKHHSFFSYRYFCQKAGITSPALYTEVVSGQRNLTGRTIESFIKGMGLSESDAAYFRTLVHFNQTENEQEKVQALERLRGLRRKVKQDIVPLDLYEYFSTWYYPVIRELACLLDWKGDYRLLARALIPQIKKSEAERAVKFLLEKGFLKIDDKGRCLQTNPALSTGSEVSSLAIRAFNEIMAKRGVEAIRQFPPSERDIRTVIAGVSAHSYALIKEEIREFISRVVRLVDDDKSSDRVYSLNLQLFPLSQSSEKGVESHEDT